MQLSKLYSNKKDFKNIQFNINGLNVIYAEVRSTLKEKKNSHDLGKTKLAELINFMLLKEIDSKHFLLKIKADTKSIFNDYVFYLEILLNSGKFLTIRRSVTTNTKISFSISTTTTNNFTPPQNWQFDNIPFKRSKGLLSEQLAFDFFHNKEYDYRKSINYSLRSQDDFNDVYELNKFSSGKDIDWKPFMFDLLGFNGELPRLKYENDARREEIQKFINSLQNEYSVNVEDRDRIVAEKALIEVEFKEVESQIDKFNFYQHDKNLIIKGIDEIENEISILNTISYRLNYEIDKLDKSAKHNFSFDLEKVNKIFEETNILFPTQLKSDYKKLLEFNYKLTTERNKLIKYTLKEKQSLLQDVNTRLKELNDNKEKLLIHITDTDVFSKFKSSQKELVKVESRLLAFQEKLNIIDRIIARQNDIEFLNEEIKETIDLLKKAHQTTDKNLKYSEIRAKFAEFYKKIMDEYAVISWSINKNNNIEFIPPKVKSKLDTQKDTAKDEGNTYMKLLCVAFDLSIICVYNKESFYRFIYHDDVLSQQDNGVKTRLLELIRELLSSFKFQYILSVIKSDLPVDENNKPVEFKSDEIILRLHDKDATGTLFGFEF